MEMTASEIRSLTGRKGARLAPYALSDVSGCYLQGGNSGSGAWRGP